MKCCRDDYPSGSFSHLCTGTLKLYYSPFPPEELFPEHRNSSEKPITLTPVSSSGVSPSFALEVEFLRPKMARETMVVLSEFNIFRSYFSSILNLIFHLRVSLLHNQVRGTVVVLEVW